MLQKYIVLIGYQKLRNNPFYLNFNPKSYNDHGRQGFHDDHAPPTQTETCWRVDMFFYEILEGGPRYHL